MQDMQSSRANPSPPSSPPPPPPKQDNPSQQLSFGALPLIPGHSHSSSSTTSRTSSPSRNLDMNRSFSLSPTPASQITSPTILPLISPNSPAENLGPSSSPTKSAFGPEQQKKSNPLTDLVGSERIYVSLLGVIIRKVAGAWSKANFPPKELDMMFRNIEAIYRANKRLLTQLKEIGLNPASPKDLGDLLMRWVDDLDEPYNKFCNNYVTGFDTWEPVTSNMSLPPILSAISSEHPIPRQPPDTNVTHWTLDSLFALPRARLKYYKKLYARLLKGSEAGRSNYKLLTNAVEKLEIMMASLAQRENARVGQSDHAQSLTESATPVSTVSPQLSEHSQVQRPPSNTSNSETMDAQTRRGFSVPMDSISPEASVSRDTANPETRVTSTSTMSAPVSNLEKRLSTERVLDLFTLKPKPVRLQINPPSLTFTRTLRLSHDVKIAFTPRAVPDSPQLHPLGHIFLLTDLLLVCERMTTDERQIANSGADSHDYDMWLLYPPLAGKHLRVSEHPGKNNTLQVLILKKETLLLETPSKADRDFLMREFKECIDAGSLLTPRPGQPPPPPVPSMKLPLSSSADLSDMPLSIGSSHAPPTSIDLPAKLLETRRSDEDQNGQVGASRSVTDPVQPHSFIGSLQRQPSAGIVPVNNNPGQPHNPNTHTQQLPPSTTSGYDPAQESLRGYHQHDPNTVMPPPRGISNPYHGSVPVGSRPFPAANQPNHGSHYPMQQNHLGHFPPPRLDMPNSHSTPPRLDMPNSHSTPPRLDMLNYHSTPPRLGTPNSFQHPPRTYEPAMNNERPSSLRSSLHKSTSTKSLSSAYRQVNESLPPIPGPARMHDGPINYSSAPHMHQPQARAPFPPSSAFDSRATTSSWGTSQEPSPPASPVDGETTFSGPVTSSITARFRCKVFLKLQHGQWKALGGAKLQLYLQQPTNIKQLVVEAESKDKAILISTIVLTDGVERVGKTGVAIELSDKGSRTGIVYMIQLKNEISASGLFGSLLAGSDRAAGRVGRG